MIPGLSLFIPLLDEAEILETNVARLLAWGRAWSKTHSRPSEILLASNGSRDATPEIAERLARAHPEEIRCVVLRERGIGRALRAALSIVRTDRLVIVDADLSVDLDFLAAAAAALAVHEVVLGSKRAGYENRPWLRRAGSGLYHLAVERLTGLRFTDYSPGAKGFRAEFLAAHERLIDDQTGFVLPLAAAAERERPGSVHEIPIRCEDLRASRFNLWNEGLYRFAHLARFFGGSLRDFR